MFEKAVRKPREAEKMVEPLQAAYSKRPLYQSIPTVLKIAGIGISLLMLVSLVLYGFSVYYESRVLHIGRETRSLEEENNDLHIHLDRLRSYQKVADVSSKIQGLKAASEIIDVAQTANPPTPVQRPAQSGPPKEAYGY